MCPQILVTFLYEKLEKNEILTESPAMGFPENHTSAWKGTLPHWWALEAFNNAGLWSNGIEFFALHLL